MRWGIIGVGDVTEAKSGPAFQTADRSELVAVMRRDGARAADYARRHGVPRWYDDADALLADPEVDAVYVATPPDSHAEYTIRAAAAGKPVYVEKPMARTAAECEAMVAACDAAGVPLFVAYYRRAMPRFVTVGDLLADGAIGDALGRSACGCRARPRPPATAGCRGGCGRRSPAAGLLLDLGSHTLDLLDHLLGPVTHCTGLAANVGRHHTAEDLVAGTFTFASGVHGVGLWLFDAAEGADLVEIVGHRRVAEVLELRSGAAAPDHAVGHPEIDAPYPPRCSCRSSRRSSTP